MNTASFEAPSYAGSFAEGARQLIALLDDVALTGVESATADAIRAHRVEFEARLNAWQTAGSAEDATLLYLERLLDQLALSARPLIQSGFVSDKAFKDAYFDPEIRVKFRRLEKAHRASFSGGGPASGSTVAPSSTTSPTSTPATVGAGARSLGPPVEDALLGAQVGPEPANDTPSTGRNEGGLAATSGSPRLATPAAMAPLPAGGTGAEVAGLDVLELPVHPAAELLPMLTGGQLESFVEDIKRRGVLEPVTLVNESGQWFLLDGRNRREAAKILGLALPFDVYPGTNPAAFVRSKNLRRRHLRSAERRAAASALLAQVKQAKAARKTDAGTMPGGNVATSDAPSGKTRDQLATDLGISARTAQDLLTVAAKATPELQQAVDDGVTTHVAAQLASLPADQQRQLVNDARKAGGSAKALKRAIGATAKALKKNGSPAGKRRSKASSGAATAGSPKAAFGAMQTATGATPIAIPLAWELVSTMTGVDDGAWIGEGTVGGVALEFKCDLPSMQLFVRRPQGARTKAGK